MLLQGFWVHLLLLLHIRAVVLRSDDIIGFCCSAMHGSACGAADCIGSDA
jgi:hypothetical protein